MTTKCEFSKLPKPKFFSELATDMSAFSYHFYRLFREIKKDVRRGVRKPSTGRRYIADLTPHQENYYKHLKTR